MTLQTVRTAAFVFASTSIVACTGGSQAPSMNAVPSSTVAQANPMDAGMCQNSDGIKVMPCRLGFDAKQPGPKRVEVTSGDNNRQVIRERDDCAAKNVATVTRISNHRYVVTAGSAKGTCAANFVGAMHNDDNGHRGSDLTVVNAL